VTQGKKPTSIRENLGGIGVLVLPKEKGKDEPRLRRTGPMVRRESDWRGPVFVIFMAKGVYHS